MKYAFIQEQANLHPARSLCRVLAVSASGYYAWRNRGVPDHVRRDEKLTEAIRRIHNANRGAYGAKKTWIELNRQGMACGKHRVARLRRQAGIEARRKQRFRITVEHHQTAPAAPNLVERQFAVAQPNRIWVGDMTYIRTRAGWLYLAILLDLYSRKVIGWSMGDRPNLAVIMAALEMALARRRPHAGVIHHTDQGPLYAARAYREYMATHGLRPSMSAKGNAYDNAVAESFFSNLKNELVHHCSFRTHDEARAAIFEYIEVFYNRQRMHQTLGYVSPEAFEQRRVSLD